MPGRASKERICSAAFMSVPPVFLGQGTLLGLQPDLLPRFGEVVVERGMIDEGVDSALDHDRRHVLEDDTLRLQDDRSALLTVDRRRLFLIEAIDLRIAIAAKVQRVAGHIRAELLVRIVDTGWDGGEDPLELSGSAPL